MPPSRPLTIFPSELLHEFASHVESTGDLLHLALTCSLLSKIVLPDHIRYRTISCKISDMDLWKHLIAYPGRTRNIRVLDIAKCVDHLRLVKQKPRSRRRNNLKDCKNIYSHFEQALSLMARLSTLRLHHPSSWPSPAGAWDAPGLHICRRMRSTGVLKHFDVTAELRLTPGPNREIQGYAKLSDMTSLHLTVPLTLVDDLEDDPDFDSSHVLCPLVNGNPDMQQLTVDCAYFVNFAPLFNTTFPKLYRLSAIGMHNRSTPSFHELAATFLSNHPFLQILHWNVTTVQETPFDQLAFGSLPFLRRLSGDTKSVLRILSSPTSILRPIEVITNVALGDGFWEGLKYTDLSTLRELGVTFFESLQDIVRLADEVPALTHLSIEIGRLQSMQKGSALQHLLLELLEVLPNFKSIRRFHVTTMISDILHPTAEALVPLLSQQLPLLGMLTHHDNFTRNYTTFTQIKTEERVSWNIEHRPLSTAEFYEIHDRY